jgi:hypothetical protein
MNLTDELTKKQALKFQVNEEIGFGFIRKTLFNNTEGIFNLHSKIDINSAEILRNYLEKNYKNYTFELNYTIENHEIMFRKIGEIN